MTSAALSTPTRLQATVGCSPLPKRLSGERKSRRGGKNDRKKSAMRSDGASKSFVTFVNWSAFAGKPFSRFLHHSNPSECR